MTIFKVKVEGEDEKVECNSKVWVDSILVILIKFININQSIFLVKANQFKNLFNCYFFHVLWLLKQNVLRINSAYKILHSQK